jgi:DNA-binding CsgD family transcriptional regulator
MRARNRALRGTTYAPQRDASEQAVHPMRMRPRAFDAVLRQFLEAAAVPERWPDALHEFAQACGAEGVAAHAADGTRTLGTVVSKGAASLYDDFVARWKAPELNSHRSRGLALLNRGWRGAFTEADIFNEQEIARDPFHQEFILPAGFPSFAGLVLAQSPGLMLSASIYRKPKQGGFERAEIALINRLVDQLRAAGELALRIGLTSTHRMAETLTAAGHPMALIGRNGRVLYMSAPFEALIGNGLQVKAGRLSASDTEAERVLGAAIARATQHEIAVGEAFRWLVVPRRGGLRPLMVQLVPVVGVANDFLNPVSAIVLLTDLEANVTGPEKGVLADAFGLAPAEARLAAQIVAGETLPEIAHREGVSRETLRSRLKSIFEKTGTSRQSELVLLLAKLVGPRP